MIRRQRKLCLQARRGLVCRVSQCRAQVYAHRQDLDSPAERTEPQDSFTKSIRAGLPDDGIAIIGMTQLGYYSRPFWKVYEKRTFFDSGYSGNLGFAFPTALGVKVARPDRAVVCVIGDGGFGYHMPELATARKYGINLVTVLFNDEEYSNVGRAMDAQFGGVGRDSGGSQRQQ